MLVRNSIKLKSQIATDIFSLKNEQRWEKKQNKHASPLFKINSKPLPLTRDFNTLRRRTRTVAIETVVRFPNHQWSHHRCHWGEQPSAMALSLSIPTEMNTIHENISWKRNTEKKLLAQLCNEKRSISPPGCWPQLPLWSRCGERKRVRTGGCGDLDHKHRTWPQSKSMPATASTGRPPSRETARPRCRAVRLQWQGRLLASRSSYFEMKGWIFSFGNTAESVGNLCFPSYEWTQLFNRRDRWIIGLSWAKNIK